MLLPIQPNTLNKYIYITQIITVYFWQALETPMHICLCFCTCFIELQLQTKCLANSWPVWVSSFLFFFSQVVEKDCQHWHYAGRRSIFVQHAFCSFCRSVAKVLLQYIIPLRSTTNNNPNVVALMQLWMHRRVSKETNFLLHFQYQTEAMFLEIIIIIINMCTSRSIFIYMYIKCKC